ncbi:MAG: hypothetical protein E6J79_14930 [Deltaproteobacteria bacterium]|nr:MAG: hypothetical protein E6J79_14930 [Deltaproteobacteria bacterium]
MLLAAGVLACQARAQTLDPSAPVPVLAGMAILSPGPRALGFDGLAADPSSIGDFQGVVVLAYMRGAARDAAGRAFTIVNDIRIFMGDYVSADGIQRRGAFGFV